MHLKFILYLYNAKTKAKLKRAQKINCKCTKTKLNDVHRYTGTQVHRYTLKSALNLKFILYVLTKVHENLKTEYKEINKTLLKCKENKL